MTSKTAHEAVKAKRIKRTLAVALNEMRTNDVEHFD